MTAALAPAPVRRGRPSAASLADSPELSRRINRNLRDELRAERAEAVDFATEVRAYANRVHLAAQSDRLDLAEHCAGAIVEAADRHLRQRGAA